MIAIGMLISLEQGRSMVSSIRRGDISMLDLSRFHGRLTDLDSHIQPSPQTYEIAAGEVGKHFTSMLYQMMASMPEEEAKRIKALTAGESAVFNDETE